MRYFSAVLLLAAVACQPLCNSFVLADSYYDVNSGAKADRFRYNLCGNVASVCEVLTTNADSNITTVQDYQGVGILVLNDSFCAPFSSQPTASLRTPTDIKSGVQLAYTSEVVNGSAYTVNLINVCGLAEPPTFTGNAYTISSGVDGCPKLDLTTLWDFFARNTLAFFITTEVLGVILMVLGVYLYRVTLLLLGLLAAFFVLVLAESIVVFQPGVPIELITSIIVITIITSVLAGYVPLYFPKLGLFVMGMWVGFFLAFILNNIALYHIVSNPPALPLMITMGVLGIGMGVLSLFIKKTFVIISTSFIGAYASIRALSWYLGKYPNEFLIAKEVHTQSTQAKVEWQYYIYVIALVILTGCSISIQFWIFRMKSKILGKKADIDQYIGKIEEDQDIERSKFIKLENVFKKEEKKVKPRYMKRRRASSEEKGESEEEDSPAEEEEPPRKGRPESKKNSQKSQNGKASRKEL